MSEKEPNVNDDGRQLIEAASAMAGGQPLTSGKRCSGCYDSFSGPWCDNCDQWPCVCDAAS